MNQRRPSLRVPVPGTPLDGLRDLAREQERSVLRDPLELTCEWSANTFVVVPHSLGRAPRHAWLTGTNAVHTVPIVMQRSQDTESAGYDPKKVIIFVTSSAYTGITNWLVV